jgi:iron complex outermembrane receptor protein
VRNEIVTPGYALVGWHLRRQWTQWELGVGVENLLDREYALPLGGTYVGQGATMSLNGIPWGIAVPGAGRTLYASVEWRFSR